MQWSPCIFHQDYPLLLCLSQLSIGQCANQELDKNPWHSGEGTEEIEAQLRGCNGGCYDVHQGFVLLHFLFHLELTPLSCCTAICQSARAYCWVVWVYRAWQVELVKNAKPRSNAGPLPEMWFLLPLGNFHLQNPTLRSPSLSLSPKSILP